LPSQACQQFILPQDSTCFLDVFKVISSDVFISFILLKFYCIFIDTIVCITGWICAAIAQLSTICVELRTKQMSQILGLHTSDVISRTGARNVLQFLFPQRLVMDLDKHLRNAAMRVACINKRKALPCSDPLMLDTRLKKQQVMLSLSKPS